MKRFALLLFLLSFCVVSVVSAQQQQLFSLFQHLLRKITPWLT